MVPEGDRLRRLQVGEARHDHGGITFGLINQRLDQPRQARIDGVERATNPELEIGRHLIVTGACRMQPSRRIADQFGQPVLHIHVDIFQRAREFEAAVTDLRVDLL